MRWIQWSWRSQTGGRCAAAVAAIGAVAVVSACGAVSPGAQGPAGSNGLPASVKLMASIPLTGPAAFAGAEAEKGYDFAVDEINDSDFLGADVELAVEKKDTQASVQQAASDLTSAVADPEVAAVLGSLSSAEASAQSPIAEKQKMPIVYIQAGSPGVVIGDYTYRFPAPMSAYYDIVSQHIEEQGWETVGVVYGSWVPTLKELGEQAFPALAKDLGLDITESVATQQTTQDFSAPISQVLRSNPDVVAILQVGPANATAMKQLRQAGYDGPVLGNSSAGAKSLEPAGKAGAGMVWPVDFDYSSKDPASQKFVEKYRAAHDGANPTPYAAEAYDAVWFVARALKKANSAAREEVAAAMQAMAEQRFTGALGTDLSFADNDLQVRGVVIEWDGEREKLLYAAD